MINSIYQYLAKRTSKIISLTLPDLLIYFNYFFHHKLLKFDFTKTISIILYKYTIIKFKRIQ